MASWTELNHRTTSMVVNGEMTFIVRRFKVAYPCFKPGRWYSQSNCRLLRITLCTTQEEEYFIKFGLIQDGPETDFNGFVLGPNREDSDSCLLFLPISLNADEIRTASDYWQDVISSKPEELDSILKSGIPETRDKD